ncbi:MAG: winged helix-turn-helix domain-containing protein [Blastocatellia bacterium]
MPITPKAFDLILALIQHHGDVLEKDEIMRLLWPNLVVEENNLTVIISSLRKALGESPEEHKYIVTIPKRGYCFVAQVNEVWGTRAGLARKINRRGGARPGSIFHFHFDQIVTLLRRLAEN